jgi:tRNA(Ile)-lysidine synthase
MASSRNKQSPESAPISGAVAAALHRHVFFSIEAPRRPKLVLGLSGGVDSVVLLHVLVALRNTLSFELSALHVHHGLSTHADAWAEFCASLCQDLGVPFRAVRVQVCRNSGLGLEAAARQARYRAYAHADGDWIVLAHHRGDQAETLLLNLLRGAGVQGAAAMPEARSLGAICGEARKTCLLRPLLAVSRADIEAYARQRGLSWVEDESNEDTAYGRNFLRADVLPRLGRRFPQAIAVLGRAAEHFAEAAELLSDLAKIDLIGVRPGEGLSIARLSGLSAARGRNLLRHWLLHNDVTMPDTRHLSEIYRQLLEAGLDAVVAIRVGRDGRHLTIRRYRGLVYLVPELPPPSACAWRGEPELAWAGGRLLFSQTEGAGIRAEGLAESPVVIRSRLGGEYFSLAARRPKRSLKKILQESAIPPWRREVLPCLWCGEELVWVAGLGVAFAWQCKPGEPGWSVSWIG